MQAARMYEKRTVATDALGALVGGKPEAAARASTLIAAQHLDLLDTFLAQRLDEPASTPGHEVLRQTVRHAPGQARLQALRAPQSTFLLLLADPAVGLARLGHGVALERELLDAGAARVTNGWSLDARLRASVGGIVHQSVLCGGVVFDTDCPDVDPLLSGSTDPAAVPISSPVVQRALEAITAVDPDHGRHLLDMVQQITTRPRGVATPTPVALTQASHPGLVVVPPQRDNLAADDCRTSIAGLVDQLVLAALDIATSRVEAIDGWYGSDHSRGIGDHLESPWSRQPISGQQLVHEIVRWCGWLAFVDRAGTVPGGELAPIVDGLQRARRLLTPAQIQHWHLQPEPAALLISLIETVTK